MISNILKKRNSILLKTAIYSFGIFGLIMFFSITLFIWITERNLTELVIDQNVEQLFNIKTQFDKNIDNYKFILEQDSNSSIFTTAVMNPVDTEYYLKDFMDDLKISNLDGELLLLAFDGQIIYSTHNSVNKINNIFTNFSEILEVLDTKKSTQILDANNNVVFISCIKYNDLVEGYLIFITDFQNIFEHNLHLFESDTHKHSFSVLNGKNIIAKVGETSERFISSNFTLESLPLSLQIDTDENVIKESTSEILHSISLISILSVILLAIIFSIITSKTVTKPLSILEHEITLVGKGEHDNLPFRKKDPIEIKFLRSSFNQMQKAIITNKVELEEFNRKLLSINSDLKSTQKQLVQSEKMASLGQLAAGVAHEINNPTGFVTTNLHTMKEYICVYNTLYKHNEELYSYIKDNIKETQILKFIEDIEIIKKEEDFKFILEDTTDLLEESIDGVVRIKDIVTGLRNFARPKSKITSPGNINNGIKDALRLTINELKYTCTIEQNLGKLVDVPCRLDQITQVFVNLLVNAAHAIKDQGFIKLTTWQEDEFIFASVEDNGEGIKPENIEKLFDPFFTTKEVGKGTGLGLSISYGIIEEHGGSIDVRSKVGEGTCFTLKFPINT